MKTLQESLMAKNLIEKDLLSSPDFKKWINQPDVFWYVILWYSNVKGYDASNDIARAIKEYKVLIDIIMSQNCMEIFYHDGRHSNVYINGTITNSFSDLEDAFGSEEAYECLNDSAVDQIVHTYDDCCDNIYKRNFKGGFPNSDRKNGAIVEFVDTILQYENVKNFNNGKIKGGFFLTDEESILTVAFKNNTPQEILKLFDIK